MSRGRRYDDTPKLNVKKVIATVIAIVVLIMVCMSLKKLLTKNEKRTQEVSTLTTYISIYENSKWGVINQKGEIIIKPTYDEMILIPDKYTDVFICTYNVDYQNETYKTKVLNAKGELILTEYENVEVLQNGNGSDNWYEKDVLRITSNGKYGLIDLKGKQILPTEYDNIYVLDGIEKSIIIEKEGKKGLFLASTGEVIIHPEYAEITALTDNYENGYIVKNAEGKSGIISLDKKVVLEAKYDEIKNVSGNGYYVVVIDKKLAVIDSSGKVAINKGFDSIETIDRDNLIIIKDNKYGIMGVDGVEVVPTIYEKIKPAISGQYYIAKKDGKYGIISNDNTVKINFIYTNINYVETANFVEAENEDYTTDILDANLKKVIEKAIISEINIDGGYLRIRKNDNYTYYNFKFEEKQNKEVLSTNTLFLFKENGKYGYKNKNDEVIVDPIYDDAKEQNSFGYCAVKKDGLWGALKSDGTVVVSPSVNLEEYLYIDFIEKWHRNNDLNMLVYIK